jgi:hypothetical protein
MNDAQIILPHNPDHDFVYVPPTLDRAYLEQVLAHALGRDAALARCTASNLCADNHGGVSHSGATVLRLSLDLESGETLHLVAKILSPDAVNLFKCDCRFDSRLAEIAWAKWWGRQQAPYVARIYDTRANPQTREFWILQEYLPQVRWPDVPGEPGAAGDGVKHLAAPTRRLNKLFETIARLHAHSRRRIHELLSLFAGSRIQQGYLCTPRQLLEALDGLFADTAFLHSIGVTEEEHRSLDAYCTAIEQRPPWVDEWDVVCVTADWAPDNLGVRDDEWVAFDWGTTRLAPMEEDLDVLLGRLELGEAAKQGLVRHYLSAYAIETGHEIDARTFTARLPWARFLVTLRYIVEHADSLRWVPYQTRSRELIHLFIRLCNGHLTDLPSRKL